MAREDLGLPTIERGLGDREKSAAFAAADGDLLIVFATAYERGYAITPKQGTSTPLGIVVSSFSDLVVGATERWLAGTADLRNEADAAPWRPYGEIAIQCALEDVPVSFCGKSDTSTGG